jgi:hypothetical protein
MYFMTTWNTLFFLKNTYMWDQSWFIFFDASHLGTTVASVHDQSWFMMLLRSL